MIPTLDRPTTTERIAFDTNAIIYFVEGVSPYREWLTPMFASIERGERLAVVSVVTEMEALVKPLVTSDLDALRRMKEFFSGGNIEVHELTRDLARASARVSADLNLDLPDAVVVATAVATKCDALVGNDSAFRKRLRDIPYIYLEDAVRKR